MYIYIYIIYIYIYIVFACQFFIAISSSDLAMLCLLQKIAGAKFRWLHEFCVVIVRFWFCLFTFVFVCLQQGWKQWGVDKGEKKLGKTTEN